MSSSNRLESTRRARRISASVIAASTLAAALAACGGSSPSGHPAASAAGTERSTAAVAGSAGAAAGALISGATPANTAGAAAAAGTRVAAEAAKGRTHGVKLRIATNPNGAAVNDPVHSGKRVLRAKPDSDAGPEKKPANASATTFNPCHLVNARQAAQILHASHVQIQTAPQGPTCIYTPSGHGAAVTLVVEPIGAAKLAHQGRLVGRLTLASRQAYCVKYGTSVLYAQLPDGSALAVSAPCAIAARFATLALPRLAQA